MKEWRSDKKAEADVREERGLRIEAGLLGLGLFILVAGLAFQFLR